MAAPAVKIEPKAPLAIPLTEAERHELIGFATAQGQDFVTWARDTLQAAARRSGQCLLVEFPEAERAAVERTAKNLNLAVPAFVRRATIAAVRRVGSRG